MASERVGTHEYTVHVTGVFDLSSGGCITDTVERQFSCDSKTSRTPAYAAIGFVRELSQGVTIQHDGQRMFARLREVQSVQMQWDKAMSVAPCAFESEQTHSA